MQKFEIFQYAEALLDIAIDENNVNHYKKQTTLLMKTFQENPQYLTLLNSISLTKIEKQQMLKKVFANKINQNFYHLLFILIDKRLIRKVDKVFFRTLSLINIYLEIVEGVIYSTIKLTAIEINKISKKISKKIKKQVILINKIDLNLYGGIKVVVGDRVFDNSTSSQIKNLKFALLKGDN